MATCNKSEREMEKQMKNIGFIILNYNTLELTQKCICAIRDNLGDASYEIVVVDNASADGSGGVLEKYYAGEKTVKVLCLEQNLGFARGNNEGYFYLREKCEFICCLNSDVFFETKDFWNIIHKEYECSRFAVLGPKIILPGGEICPFLRPLESLEHEEKRLWNKRLHLLLARLGLEELRKKKKCDSDIWHRAADEVLSQKKENLVLQGCCLICSPEYIKAYEDLFDPRTFLYGEEFLLYLRIKDKNLTTEYFPELVVHHLFGESRAKEKNGYKKDVALWKNSVKSQTVLVKEMRRMARTADMSAEKGQSRRAVK